jgi:pimeloyl-ACP methyl ester carboxylesterase
MRPIRENLFCLALLIGANFAPAQELKDVQKPRSPLVLQSQGSFYVGGESVEQSQSQLGFGPAPGHVTVNQMYVRFMAPPRAERKPAVVMVHGMTLTGKTYETTPDGRMGWDEYFVRKGHAVYVPDQVARGRSGFNQQIFNDARAGKVPAASLPAMRRFSDELNWPNFRFGPKPGQPFPDEQFPTAAIGELSKQSIPDLNTMLPAANPSFQALAQLAAQLQNTVIMGHSQGGVFPLEAALINPAGVKGMILVEPGTCPARYTDEQIKTLSQIPALVIFGDHLDQITGVENTAAWKTRYDECQRFIQRIKQAGGKSEMLYPPDLGIRGNSHMIMQDKNHLQIADLILAWIQRSVTKSR